MRRHLAARALAALALAGVGLAASACTSPRDVLGPTESPCFRAIAVARLAVRGRGTFTGVRSVTGARLDHLLEPAPASHEPLAYSGRTGLCLVAYRGRFDVGDVERGMQEGPFPDRLALVIVREVDEKLVATLVVQRAPLPLTKAFPIFR